MAPAIAVSALLAGAVLATPLAAWGSSLADTTPAPSATSSPAPTDSGADAPTSATDAAVSAVSLALAPAGNGVVGPGADLTLTFEMTNPGLETIDGGSVDIVIDRSELDGTGAYSTWLDGESAETTVTAENGTATGTTTSPATGTTASTDASTLVTVATTPLPPGGSHTQQLTVPAADLQLDAWGVYGVGATLSVDGAVVGAARSTIVYDDGTTPAPPVAGVTVIAPITSLPSSTGLIPAAALEAATNEAGSLTRELDAVVDRPVTLAVDPRIIVSIRALGSTAPASAVAWLERLDAASNPVIPLTFADSDIAGEHQAGAPAVLAPTSFAYALDPANFTDVDELIEPTATATPTPTVTASPGAEPTPTPAPVAVPTLEQLTDWDYTSTSIAWPRSGSVVADDLPFFAQSGLTTSIVDSAQLVAASGAGDPVDASVTAGDQNVLVADHSVSLAFQNALAASSDTRRGEALAELSGSLAIAARAGTEASGTDSAGTDAAGTDAGTDPRQVLAVLDRNAMNLGSIDQALSVMQSLAWATPAPLDSLLATTPTQVVSVLDAPESAERVAQIANLLGGSQRIDAFSSVLTDPLVLTGESRADLLALLSNSWTPNEGGWNVAVQANLDATATTLASVQVIDGSSINLLANQANLPVTISNELPYPVTVVLHVTPSNGRLVVEKSDVEVTIEASSRKGAQIPVEAGVANGPVTLSFQLLSPTGVLLSTPSPVVVNVSADWETWGTVIVAVLVVALFGFGIVRNILRRRKRHRDGDPDAADAEPDPNAPISPEPAPPAVAVREPHE
ncbi:DUF6049 family protein [Herbiconiux daphne]|uniref:DUF6049 family protein n=1 Tax=Herbiconiux daphne TaxID=2970914 RepID=A0ABT2H629_9MICO|nr:DUF6049 family protein [Herbiconiux daphne]MCS5735384.1 DUF6049 family protein [Herbiconiux daphne]